MELKSFNFAELKDTSREWTASQVDLQKINLFVGKNASGKSRLLNSIYSLCSLVNRPPEKLWASGSWECEFLHENSRFDLKIELREGMVFEESLLVDGDLRLERN